MIAQGIQAFPDVLSDDPFILDDQNFGFLIHPLTPSWNVAGLEACC
jgi:hypothetical protein